MMRRRFSFSNTKENNLRVPFEKNPSSGKVEYYDDEGKHLKTSFLKHLLNSVELPSILRNVFIPCSTGGKHKGTDYAALRNSYYHNSVRCC
jgi:hypothetical protein